MVVCRVCWEVWWCFFIKCVLVVVLVDYEYVVLVVNDVELEFLV